MELESRLHNWATIYVLTIDERGCYEEHTGDGEHVSHLFVVLNVGFFRAPVATILEGMEGEVVRLDIW